MSVQRYSSGVDNLRGHQPAANAVLDDLDRRLLKALSADARMTNSALAKEVGIAQSTCHLRMRRLVERGVIRAFSVDIAPEALGQSIQAFIAVRLQPSARQNIGSFASAIAGLSGVLNVYFLAGADDFLVHVATASVESLRHFVVQNLSKAREVASTQTNLIFEHTPGRVGVI